MESVNLRKCCEEAIAAKLRDLMDRGRFRKSTLVRGNGWANLEVVVLPVRLARTIDWCVQEGNTMRGRGAVAFLPDGGIVLGSCHYTGYKKIVTWDDIH